MLTANTRNITKLKINYITAYTNVSCIIRTIYRLRAIGELARRPSLLSSFDMKSSGDLDRLR